MSTYDLSPAGDAAPVGAAEVRGIAGPGDGEVGALGLGLVGAVVAVWVAVAPPVLGDAPPALGTLEERGRVALPVGAVLPLVWGLFSDVARIHDNSFNT